MRLRENWKKETADLSTTLPRISCWSLVALVHFMRPSLRKGAHAALSSAAWQEIRVRSGRDDKFCLGTPSIVSKMNCHLDRSVA